MGHRWVASTGIISVSPHSAPMYGIDISVRVSNNTIYGKLDNIEKPNFRIDVSKAQGFAAFVYTPWLHIDESYIFPQVVSELHFVFP